MTVARPEAVPVARPGALNVAGAGALLLPIGAAILASAAFFVAGFIALPIVSAGSGGVPSGELASVRVSALALREIPPRYLHLYIAAGARYGLDWAILAGIGRVECDHGRDRSPSCTQPGAVNAAGAGGPMQFLAGTWDEYGVDPYGAGPPDRWAPADAIFAAANYLRASGAPANYDEAIFAYNHASWYVEEVKSWARRYEGSPGERGARTILVSAAVGSEGSSAGIDADRTAGSGSWGRAFGADASETPVLYVAGSEAKLLRGDGHVALIPEDVPPSVQAMVIAGNELQQMPYGPAGHPDPLRASSEDCSSTVNYVLYRAGVRPLKEILERNPLAQDYVHWGEAGRGRWVTIYATDVPQPHVFIVIAGLRLDTSYNGTDEGPNRDEAGPRWRLLPYIPRWAHWSVRHPPGL